MKNWKIYIVLACLLIAIGAVLFAHIQYKKLEQLQSEIAAAKIVHQAEAKIIAKRIDRDGIEHTILDASANIITPDDVKKAKKIENVIDTAAAAMGVQSKQIQELTSINLKITAEKLEMQGIIDSLSRMVYYYADQYINAKFTPSGNNTGILDYNYHINLSHNRYSIGDKTYIDIYTNDKRATIEGVKRLVVEHPVKKNSLAFFGGALYDVTNKGLLAGPGAKLNLGNLQVRGQYAFISSSNNWTPLVGVDYNIVNFRF